MTEEDITWREKLASLKHILSFNPPLTTAIFTIGLATAALEGIGLSFILPIVEIAQQSGDPTAEAEGLMAAFVLVYETLGIPFTLEHVIVGVTGVMTVRFTLGFLNIWLRGILRHTYVRHLQSRAFESTLDARVSYFDREGSDDILNAIVTQAVYGGEVITAGVQFLEKSFLAIMFALLALYLAPLLTMLAAAILGIILFIFRYVVESGYSVGDRVAKANERIQESVQAGTQGIREVKLFGLSNELHEDFFQALDNYVTASIKARRNQGGLNQFYQLTAAIVMFVLIYLAIVFTSLSLAALGLFLFAMFRLSPILSTLNHRFYKLESNLPHLIRTQEFVKELEKQYEPSDGRRPAPATIEKIVFDDVEFAYGDEQVLDGVSFKVDCGEFVAFVGRSGAGKSTIASLLARMYEPDQGTIKVNGTPVKEFDIDEWRSKIAYVRQDNFIFNDTLKYNLTISRRTATREEIDRVCKIARIDEFFDELPDGYETTLGEDGVQLSGGQRQRVAIARALLKDAELLLLDEATSDLDSNLEEEIQRAIESMSDQYTTIAIAHRLSTVMNADRIYTLESGSIIEVGDHQKLLKESGKYAELYNLQTRQV